MLRHSKITWTAGNTEVGVSDEMAKKMFRWKKSSRMYSRYVHMQGLDSKGAYLALAGVKQETKCKPKILAPLKCLGCGEINSAGSLYCSRCGLVLNEEQAQRLIAERRKLDRLMEKVLAMEKEKKK